MQELRLASLRSWLQQHGSDVSGLEFDRSEGKGYGVYASSYFKHMYGNKIARTLKLLNPWQQSAVASIPSLLIINADTIQHDEVLGPVLAEHLKLQNINEAEAVQLWLVMHRLMQAASPYAPYIENLPVEYSTPLHYSEDKLRANLAGTTLQLAVQDRKHKLGTSWEQLQPVVKQLMQQCQAKFQRPLREPSLDDWQWAFSTFRSRAMAVPYSDKEGDSVKDSLVPGLDMFNHSSQPNCTWRVRGDLREDGCVQVMAPRNPRPAPGNELTIRYKYDSNGALLFAHGFAEMNNPDDDVMVICRLGDAEQLDNAMRARLQLIRNANLPLVFFLPRQRPKGQLEALPSEGRAILTALVTTEEEVAMGLGLQQPGQLPPARSAAESLGLDMAIYTSFLRLLELQLTELEGAEGTGPLEQDIAKIVEGPENLKGEEWHCLLYRANQKRIVRGYMREAAEHIQALQLQLAVEVAKEEDDAAS